MPSDLPVNRFQDQILKTVVEHPVVVVIGETGSGKTTQLSQILHRAGYTKSGMVGVTQPRRVAAVSVARRVAFELGVQVGEEVGYSIRFEDRTSENTCIKYLTDGCLLRECLFDPQLKQYSVIILDEAHERTLNTDILLGLLQRIAGRKFPELKVIITSATLDGEKMSRFFSGCPVLIIPGMVYPVEILYSTEQPVSYVESSIQTAIDIHAREPAGDILLFMTGQDEIEKVVLKLEERVGQLEEGSCMDAIILPLYASLPPEMQVRVFTPAPSNCRRIIVATNIAETSLTVDGVVYVIDPGFVKQRQYNPATGMHSLVVVHISKVQAVQRAGRAGRTCPGKCYRIYPEALYLNEFPAVTVPEIQRSSLNSAVLHLKSLELPDIDVLQFDFLDPPSRECLEDALQQLYIIGAIDQDGFITVLGKRMAELPLEPSLARVLLAAEEMGCLNQALTVAAMLSCESLFMPMFSKLTNKKRHHEDRKLPDGKGLGDHIQLLQIYEDWQQAGCDPDWCKKHGLQVRSMLFAKEVRHQLSLIMSKRDQGCMQVRSKARSFGDIGNTRPLRKAFCTGFANHLAQRLPRHNGYRTVGIKSQLVQIHPSACPMETDEEGLLPEWVVYGELVGTSRPFIKCVCAVEGPWVKPALVKLDTISVHRLSRSSATSAEAKSSKAADGREIQKPINTPQESCNETIEAARKRFLSRKSSKLQNATS
eukprot:c16414_g1_i1 orf=285-2411(+)